MRRFLTVTFLLLLLNSLQTSIPMVHAAAFTPGNLVIYRVGSGAGSLVNTGNPVFLDEYTPAGGLVQSIPLPTIASGGNFPLIASGTATSEGFITLSPDYQRLILTGYGSTIPCSVNCATTTAGTVPRVVGIVNSSEVVDTTTALTDFASGSNPRSAVTTNGTDIWVAGGAGGVRYTTLGATTSTQVSATVTNLRNLRIFANQLYVSSSSGAIRVATVGTGLPTTSGQTITNLPGFPTTGSPYGFILVDLDAGVVGVDTLYVADDSAVALTKYSLVAGSWTANGTIGIAADAYRGLAAVKSGTTVTLYAIRGAGSGTGASGQFVSLVDSSGYNGAFAGTPTLLASAGTNTVFRGISLAPGSGPTAVTHSQPQAHVTFSILWLVLLFLAGFATLLSRAWSRQQLG